MREILDKICHGENASKDEIHGLFMRMVAGELDPVEISALLVALRTKGETPDEIAGAAAALRQSALQFPKSEYPLADSCGTGGDSSGTFNISTASAIVSATLGIKMAKHGNRSISSKCGSADVLEQLGVKIDVEPEVSKRCLDEAGICFLFAPRYHSGLRHAMPVRKALGIRTMFNVLGPLVNPTSPDYQVMGVYDAALCEPMAQTLGMLGCKGALVVHGSGLDEIAVHGPTTAALYKAGKVTSLELSPELAGQSVYPLESIVGNDPVENADILKALFSGDGSDAANTAVALNAGALCWIFGMADSFKDGVAKALTCIKSGDCTKTLNKLVKCSNGA